MPRLAAILGVLLLSIFASRATFAQSHRVIDTQEAAEEICAFSRVDPEGAQSAEPLPRERRVEYHKARKSLVSTPIRVRVSRSEFDYRRYDRATGFLEIPLFRDMTVVPGWSLRLTPGDVLRFPISEERALELQTLIELQQAHLVVEVLPRAFRRWDEAFCTPSEARHVIHAALLGARIIDPVGKEHTSVRSSLGDEIAVLRDNKIAGYLGGALPTVTVSSLVQLHEQRRGAPVGGKMNDDALTAFRHELERQLFGCYVRGLTRNSRLQGALVATLSADENGARIVVDSVHESSVTDCAIERLNDVAAQRRAALPAASNFRVTTIFRLQDAGSL